MIILFRTWSPTDVRQSLSWIVDKKFQLNEINFKTYIKVSDILDNEAVWYPLFYNIKDNL